MTDPAIKAAAALPWSYGSHDEDDGSKTWEIWSGDGHLVAEINDECRDADAIPFPAQKYAVLIVAAVNRLKEYNDEQ